jgi:hypothetical protein
MYAAGNGDKQPNGGQQLGTVSWLSLNQQSKTVKKREVKMKMTKDQFAE